MLITPDDETKVTQISEAGAANPEETSWLCNLVQRLARLKPTEEDFPTYAALIHPTSSSAFALRFVSTIPFERETRILEGHPTQIELFNITTENAVCDAHLCVRPYIRMLEPADDKVLSRLARHGRIRVDIDGERVIDGGSIEEHLVDFDGYGLRRKPFHFQASPPLFQGTDLQTASPAQEPRHLWNPNDMYAQAQEGFKRGLFLPNRSRVMIWLTGVDLQPDEHLLLSTGLVMGHYTTRATGAPASPSRRPSRKEWDPRD